MVSWAAKGECLAGGVGSAAIERVQAEQAKNSQLLSSLVRGLIPAHQSSTNPSFEISSRKGSLECTFHYPIKSQQGTALTEIHPTEKKSNMTRRKPVARKASEPTQAMEVFSRKSYSRCKDWCSCACHKKNVLRMKDLSSLGSFSLAYSGLPWLTATCDQKSC